MAKITITRLFEVSRYLTSDAGKQLKDALTYLSEFVEVVTRNLTNGLTYADNFDVILKNVTVRPDTETEILIAGNKRVQEVRCRKVVNNVYYRVSSFGWKYSSVGNVVIKVGFDDSPPATEDIALDLIVYYG